MNHHLRQYHSRRCDKQEQEHQTEQWIVLRLQRQEQEKQTLQIKMHSLKKEGRWTS
jgi:hypothetical protein